MTRAGISWAAFAPGKLDRRLRWLLLAGLAVAAGELSLRVWEAQKALDRELSSVRNRIQLLQTSADQINWTQRGQELKSAHEQLQSQLWHAPSEAQAQAMLRDWLSANLKTPELKKFTISLQPVQVAKSGKADASTEVQLSPGSGKLLASQAVRVRAAVSFELAPGTLEAALRQIEQGGQLASIDTLTASKRSRRVEMNVSLPVIIAAAGAPEPENVPKVTR